MILISIIKFALKIWLIIAGEKIGPRMKRIFFSGIGMRGKYQQNSGISVTNPGEMRLLLVKGQF